MSEQKAPFVPVDVPTPSANMATVTFNPGNDGIQLQVGDLRDAPGEKVGDYIPSAIFELGRFMLTPRALRQLFDCCVAAIKSYEENTGSPLPTQQQYIARAAVAQLSSQIQPPQPPPESTEQGNG